MAAAPIFDADRGLDRRYVAGELSGNLCRCTGYDSIVAAIIDAGARAVTETLAPVEAASADE
jgi:aerobic-type carbon monoxide dehydrogenase small subunit (CoxS/CutS family)